MRIPFLATLCTAALLWQPSAHAQAPAFPSKPLTIVVPYPPGGAADSLARALSQRLATALKQPVLVDNRAGGNTLIGAGAVARAPADGHTLLLTAEATLAMNPHLYSKLPYDPDTSFAPVAALASVSQGLVVAASSPFTSLSSFVAAARQGPAAISYATLGTGSTAHLNMELFQRATGTRLTGVPYKGAAPALTDLIGGHVQSMIVSVGQVSEYVHAGKLRLLAVAGQKRSALVPDAPTFAEAGIRNFSPSSWFALLAPAGTPAAIVQRINTEVDKALADPAFKSEFLDKAGLEAMGGTPQQLTLLIKSERAKWGHLIREANIRLE